MNNETLVGQLREMYGRVAYTHKTHEKMADRYIARYKRIKTAEICISALAASSIVLAVFGDTKTGTIIGAALSTVLLGFLLYFKEASLGEQAQKHTVVASRLWGARERLLGILVDLNIGGDSAMAAVRRDAINKELEEIYRGSPRTDSKVYAAAQRALKDQEELFFSDSELDHLLPKQLRASSEVPAAK
jgi:hypothetical protein